MDLVECVEGTVRGHLFERDGLAATAPTSFCFVEILSPEKEK